MDINKRIERLEQELELLKADVKKENNVWKPKEHEYYFVIESDGRVEKLTHIYPSELDKRLSIGNVFKTHEEAEFALEKLKVEQELRRYAEPFDQYKEQWAINYYYKDEAVNGWWASSIVSQGAFYFGSKETIHKAIEEVGESRIKKYIFGIEEE